MSELDRIVGEIRALPAEGDGMTVGEIAEAVSSDAGMVVAALEEIADIYQEANE